MSEWFIQQAEGLILGVVAGAMLTELKYYFKLKALCLEMGLEAYDSASQSQPRSKDK